MALFHRVRHPEAGLAKGRLETLVDGTAAIVLTLLVLDIRVPQESHDLVTSLRALAPNLAAFFVSVAVVGAFWLGHAHQFNFVVRVDRWSVWLNVIGMGFFALIPFLTAFLAEYWLEPLPLALYGIDLVLVGLVAILHWTYAARSRRLVHVDVHEHVVRSIETRTLLSVSLTAVGVVCAFFASPYVALALYGGAFIPFLLPGIYEEHLRPAHP